MVHWDRKKHRRRLVAQILVLVLASLLFAMIYQEEVTQAGRDSPLTLVQKFEVPLKEISGLAVMPRKNGTELAFVGDRKAEILAFAQPSGQSVGHSFKNQLLDRFSLCRTEDFEDCKRMVKKLTSNWEALSVDGAGRFFILQEHTQSIVVLSSDFKTIEKVIHFNFAHAFPELVNRGTRKFRLNALGEGMILLKNGHVLIAKEQYPLAFVEFGPEGDQALGVSPESVLGATELFSIPGNEMMHLDYQPLATWIVAGHSKCDFSDLAIDGQGRMLVLSQTCRHVEVFDRLVPGLEAKPRESIQLPADIASPEALAVKDDLWFIASDIPTKREYNFYILRFGSHL
jgi:hypothetical protein